MRHPDLAEQIIKLGCKLYELGADAGLVSTELRQLSSLFQKMSSYELGALGFSEAPNDRELLIKVFDLGGRLLLQSEAETPMISATLQ